MKSTRKFQVPAGYMLPWQLKSEYQLTKTAIVKYLDPPDLELTPAGYGTSQPIHLYARERVQTFVSSPEYCNWFVSFEKRSKNKLKSLRLKENNSIVTEN